MRVMKVKIMAAKMRMKGIADRRMLVAICSSVATDAIMGPAMMPRMSSTTMIIGKAIGTGNFFAIGFFSIRKHYADLNAVAVHSEIMQSPMSSIEFNMIPNL